jgi:ABC-type dipeptide/oligopeptide/nickel transport system permease component
MPGRRPWQLTVAALVLAAVAASWPASPRRCGRTRSSTRSARLGSLFGLSMPIFWTGLVLIVVFSLWLNWLPVGGAGSLTHLCCRPSRSRCPRWR